MRRQSEPSLDKFAKQLQEHLIGVTPLGVVRVEYLVALLAFIQAGLDRWLCELFDQEPTGLVRTTLAIIGEAPAPVRNDRLLLLRREALAICTVAVSFALVVKVEGDLASEVMRLNRLFLDYLGMMSDVGDRPHQSSGEELKRDLAIGVIGKRHIEPIVDQLAKADPFLKDLVFDYGAVATGSSHLSERVSLYSRLSPDGSRFDTLKAIGAELAKALRGVPLEVPNDFGFSYAVAAYSVTAELLDRVSVRRSTPDELS